MTLEDPSCVVLTRSQHPSKTASIPTSFEILTKGKETMNRNLDNGSKVQEVQMVKRSESDNSFDIVEFCIQISPIEYLKLNPKELEKLIKYVQEGNPQLKPSSLPLVNLETSQYNKEVKTMELFATSTSKISIDEPVEPSHMLDQKPEPFYVSLFINGYKLNNCIIDLGASDNIMPSIVAKALGLPLTKTFGKCYSMDSK